MYLYTILAMVNAAPNNILVMTDERFWQLHRKPPPHHVLPLSIGCAVTVCTPSLLYGGGITQTEGA